jgi:hypothetical protein
MSLFDSCVGPWRFEGCGHSETDQIYQQVFNYKLIVNIFIDYDKFSNYINKMVMAFGKLSNGCNSSP